MYEYAQPTASYKRHVTSCVSSSQFFFRYSKKINEIKKKKNEKKSVKSGGRLNNYHVRDMCTLYYYNNYYNHACGL